MISFFFFESEASMQNHFTLFKCFCRNLAIYPGLYFFTVNTLGSTDRNGLPFAIA